MGVDGLPSPSELAGCDVFLDRNALKGPELAVSSIGWAWGALAVRLFTGSSGLRTW